MPKDEENVEDQTTEETESEETEEETAEGTEEEETIESLKAKIAEKEKALAKANKERAANQRKYKELRDKSGDKDQPETPTLTDAAKRAFVVAELRAEGLTDAQAKRLARLASLDEIDLDDDGDVVGIDLDDIKEEFAALFEKSEGTPARPKNGGRKPATGDKSGSANPPSGQSDVTRQMLKMAQIK